MMDRIKILFILLFISGSGWQVIAENNLKRIPHERSVPEQESFSTDERLLQDVKEALKQSEKITPDLHREALKVWGSFKASVTPHYSYRFWARNLVAWLRKEKKRAFNTEDKVRDVFVALHALGTISQQAVFVLTVDVWNYLVYHEGLPDFDASPPGEHDKDKEALEVQT